MQLLKKTFRLSEQYELLRFEMLSESLQYQLNDLENDADFYGILSPVKDKSLVIKSVNKELALLLLSLKEPAKIPNYIINHDKKKIKRTILELLFSNVLEVNIEGKFIAGTKVSNQFPIFISSHHPVNYLGKLSLDAIKYGIKLPINDVTTLGARLYFYNRYPLSENWKKNIIQSSPCEVDKINNSDLLNNYWKKLSSNSDTKDWVFWQKSNNNKRINNSESTYKLYISPEPSHIRQVLEKIIPILTTSNVYRFKYGSDLYGILRPDKIIIYFNTYENLIETAECLVPILKPFKAHGVPFTSQLDDKGIISWGADPPKSEKKINWQETQSWRVWIAYRLANAIIQARSESFDSESILLFVLRKIEQVGIDVKSWSLKD